MYIRTFILITLYIVVYPTAAKAQAVDVKVGDSLTLGSCSNTKIGFLHIDIVTKTRWVDRGLTYDTTNGDGFYEFFFNEGDADSRRLPCEYAGKKFRIASMDWHKTENGGKKLVILGQIDIANTVLWIEADAAIAAKELTL